MARIAPSDSYHDDAGGDCMWRYAAFRKPDSYTMADSDNDSHNGAITHPKPIADRNAHPSAQGDSDPSSTSRAAAGMRPCARCAAGFTNGYRSWKHEPDAG